MIANSRVPKLNVLISHAASVKLLRLSKTVIYLFRLYQIIFCIDLGFFEYKTFKTKLFCRIIAILQTIAIYSYCVILLFKSEDYATAGCFTIFMTQYFLIVCVMNFNTKGTSFQKFLNTLLAIDTQLNFRRFNHIGAKILVFIILSTASRIAAVIGYCRWYFHVCASPWDMFFFNLLPNISLDTIFIFYYSIFYSVYLRLIKLTTILNKKDTNIVSCHFLYKFIAENTSKVKYSFDIAFVIAVVFYVPVVMSAIFNSLVEFKVHGWDVLLGMSLRYFTLFQSAMILFAAPLSAHMLSFQTEKMRIVLLDMLLEEQDDTRYRDIRRLIDYIAARPFKLRACNVVPLDASLPIIILNLCVTYLIVIVQFNHIY
ncbi:hypothetical protein K1T71_012318 [Dendrolimus kikuchii]|uniref:Uncharacterized protein n=1 Tax=Dendrolimus kikuchii TaxID=765133 RepID=A0ACC1CLG6_9NEOP|nr:hypothetical protein K1T71_012318 [Dendrolimus kikuchii]